jgi:hypothetical protein
MRKSIFMVFVLLVILTAAAAADAASFKIKNETGSDLHGVYISDAGTDDWEENLAEGDPLPAGVNGTVTIPNYDEFDVRIEDEAGNFLELRGIPKGTKGIVVDEEGNFEEQ